MIDVDEEKIECIAVVRLSGLYAAMLVFIITSVTSIFSGLDLGYTVVRSVLALFIAWPIGCVVGYLGFRIVSIKEDKDIEEEIEEDVETREVEETKE